MIQIVKSLMAHPFNAGDKMGALLRFAKWQINTRLNPYPVIYPFTEHSKLLMSKGLTGATGNLYSGLHEFYDMGFLLHFLREKDVFVDIGANIGSYTILASAEINAFSISIEPIPSTFSHLKNNIVVNQINHLVTPLNIGLGSKMGSLKFTKSRDTENHIATQDETDTIDVEVDTLDNIIAEEQPTLLKIDVEGFETEVLNGAEATLNKSSLKAIIIELNGEGNRYGYDENAIHQKLLVKGFVPHRYNPFDRSLVEITSSKTDNAIYIRDVAFVRNRLTNARKININHQQI
jgi:FkbM family methyltransferase